MDRLTEMNKIETAIAEIAANMDLSVNTIETAIETLSKEIPYKPTKCAITYGLCKCKVGFTDKETNYCGNCGQRLDWSDGNG